MGSCLSHTGRSDLYGDDAAADAARVSGVARPLLLPARCRTRQQACSRPAARARGSGSRSFPRSLPFAFACGGSVALEHTSGVLGMATPGALRSFPHLSSPEAPSLPRHYPLSSVLRASPPPGPARPVPGGIPVGRVHATDRASRVATAPSCVHATVSTPAEPSGCREPNYWGLYR